MAHSEKDGFHPVSSTACVPTVLRPLLWGLGRGREKTGLELSQAEAAVYLVGLTGTSLLLSFAFLCSLIRFKTKSSFME